MWKRWLMEKAVAFAVGQGFLILWDANIGIVCQMAMGTFVIVGIHKGNIYISVLLKLGRVNN